jgi:hypothetical protein
MTRQLLHYACKGSQLRCYGPCETEVLDMNSKDNKVVIAALGLLF